MTLWTWPYLTYHVEFKSDLAAIVDLSPSDTFYAEVIQMLRERTWPTTAPAKAAALESKHSGVTLLFCRVGGSDGRWRRKGGPFPQPWNDLTDDLIADEKFRSWVVQEAGERLARLSKPKKKKDREQEKQERENWIIGITAFQGSLTTIRCCDSFLAKRAELQDQFARGRKLKPYQRAMIDSWFEHLRNHLAHWPERELCAELGDRKRHGKKPPAFRVLNETDAFQSNESGADDDAGERFGIDGIADASEPDPAERAAEKDEAKTHVRKALDRLDVQQRAIIQMYFFDGLTYREISDGVGLTEQRVGELCRAALQQLRRLLTSQGNRT